MDDLLFASETTSGGEAAGVGSKEAAAGVNAAQEPKPSTAHTSPSKTVKRDFPSARAKKSSPLAAAATALNRLHSLYSSSLFSQQRQKRLRPAGANVPTTFRVSYWIDPFGCIGVLLFTLGLAGYRLAARHRAQDETINSYCLPVSVSAPQVRSMICFGNHAVLTSNNDILFLPTSSRIKKQALQSFITGTDHVAQTSPSQHSAVRWHQALQYFVHPAAPVPSSLLLNRANAASTSDPLLLGGPKGERKRKEKAFFAARWHTWQEAFRDVYMNFRRHSTGIISDDGSFYLCSSDFVVCFLYDTSAITKETNPPSIISLCRQHDDETESPDEIEGSIGSGKRSKLRAVMSQSNSRIRKVLHHLNVEYSMPYVNANETKREVGEFHLLEEEREANQSRSKNGSVIAPMTRAAPSQENMHGADSLLLFHGHDAVHGLYEFLINRAPMSNQDVPELYALHPFANASIQSLQVTSFGRVAGSSTGAHSEEQPSEATTLFRTEVLGFCFPSSIVKLLNVLKDEWEGVKSSNGLLAASCAENDSTTRAQDPQIAVRTYMESMSGAERLNAAKLDEQFATGATEKLEDLQQRPKRQQDLQFSKRRMEAAVVTKVDSRYAVETTTRPTVVRP
ncbi:unnamed protein product [Phytophthora lilii]|uniref:Unnamed protein product n=1 Tax=Phytophthora lilii TaxID=2077276 RepID=A0A9W6X1D3_9STRA|nr:unnamed protein product [Phytophthora lilii]